MRELAPDISVSAEMLHRVVEAGNTHFFTIVEEDGCIVGCASLCVFDSPMGRKASVEDVVTSNPKRGSANALYKAVGFEPRETNVYVMKIR